MPRSTSRPPAPRGARGTPDDPGNDGMTDPMTDLRDPIRHIQVRGITAEFAVNDTMTADSWGILHAREEDHDHESEVSVGRRSPAYTTHIIRHSVITR